MKKLRKFQQGCHILPKPVRPTFFSDHEYHLTSTMWAAQFRPPSPPLQTRTPLPTPPHPLQIILPSALQYLFVQDRHTFLANQQTPATPPPSIVSSDLSNSLGSAFSNNNDPMIVAGDKLESTLANGRSGTSSYTILPREETCDDGPTTTSFYHHCSRIPSY